MAGRNLKYGRKNLRKKDQQFVEEEYLKRLMKEWESVMEKRESVMEKHPSIEEGTGVG